MRPLLATLAVLTAAPFLTAAQSASDPLAPAHNGMVQCIEPNAARKTCMGIASYRFRSDQITSPVSMIVSQNEPIIYHMETVVYVKDGAVCGVATESDFRNARYTVGGQDLPSGVSRQIGTVIADQSSELLNKEVCTYFRRRGAVWATESYVAGERFPEGDLEMMWVSPSDGYRIGM